MAGSGDLRNIIRTINELPSDYSGEITVLFNDPEPIVVARSVVFLLALGRSSDKAKAADHALHCLYSTFISTIHEFGVRLAVKPLLDSCFVGGLKVDGDGNHTFSSPLGATSNLSGATPYSVIGCLFRLINGVCDAAGQWRLMRCLLVQPVAFKRHSSFIFVDLRHHGTTTTTSATHV